MNIPDITHQLLPGQRAGRAVRTLACQLRDALTLDDTMTRMTTRVSTGQYWSWLAQLVVLRSGLCAACDEPCARLGLRRSCEGTSQKSLKLMSLQTTLKGEQSCSMLLTFYQTCSQYTQIRTNICSHTFVTMPLWTR